MHNADDIKTTTDASPKGFQKSISTWGYHLQLAWYMRGLQKLGIPCNEFIFIAIEKTPPFSVGVYSADREMILFGNQEINKLVVEIDKALNDKNFPDYTPEIMPLGLPPWMIEKKQDPQHEDIELY